MNMQVGEIYYDVTLDTAKMIRGQREVDASLKKTSGSLDNFERNLTFVAKAVASLATALYVVGRIDAFTKLNAQLKIATSSTEEFTRAQADVKRIAQESQADISSVAVLYARIASATKELGIAQQQVNDITRTVALALKVSGASAQETASATLQLSQAFASGVLRGEEFNAVNEAAPRLMQALADGLNVPRGALRAMAEDGRLTSAVLANELPKALEKLAQEAGSIQTIGGAFQMVRNELTLLIGEADKATGSSVLLTGAGKGLAEVLEQVATQLAESNRQAQAFDSNDAVQTWARETRTFLSYVVDAADMAWQTLSVLGRNVAFVFKSVGAEIGGIAAQAAAVAKGDFSRAAAIGDMIKADAEKRRAELDAADAKTLSRTKTMGQAMRDAWRAADSPQGRADALRMSGGARGGAGAGYDRAPAALPQAGGGTNRKLKAPGVDKESFDLYDAQVKAFIENQRMLQDAIDTSLDEAVRNNDARLQKRDQGRLEATQLVDPVEALRMEQEARIAVLEEYRVIDLENSQLYEDAKVAVAQETAQKIKDIEEKRVQDQLDAQSQLLGAYGGLFGNMADLARTFAGEQSGIYKAMFAVSKAFAIADSIVKIQQGIANAASLPFPANMAAIGSVVSATAGVISTIQSAKFSGGRRYGGPTNAGSLYRVNESGRPEMFTASNGNQFMMPTANGRVTSADKVGGGAVVNVVVNNNHSGAAVDVQRDNTGQVVSIAIKEVATQIAENRGPVWRALRGSTNTRGQL